MRCEGNLTRFYLPSRGASQIAHWSKEWRFCYREWLSKRINNSCLYLVSVGLSRPETFKKNLWTPSALYCYGFRLFEEVISTVLAQTLHSTMVNLLSRHWTNSLSKLTKRCLPKVQRYWVLLDLNVSKNPSNM